MIRIRAAFLASAGALAMLPCLAGTATAQTAGDGKAVSSAYDNINLAISGQVNRMVNIANDGEETEVFHVDNDNSSTRMRLVGSGRVNNDFSLGTTIEVQMESNSSATVSQVSESGIGGGSFTERKLEAWFQSKRAGKLTIGQGDTASNGTSEVDLSGTTVIGYSGIADTAGGLLFRDNTGALVFGSWISRYWSNMDGQSRDDRLRYDTPNWGGFVGSGSAIADGAWDLAARFGRDFGPVKLATAIAYGQPRHSSAVDIDWRLNGSASVLITRIGVSFTAAAGMDSRDEAANDPFFWYTKLGWQSQSLVPLGSTAFAVDFGKADEIRFVDDALITVGFQAVQRIAGYGTELYLGVRYHDLDSNVADTEAITVVSIGTRIKF